MRAWVAIMSCAVSCVALHSVHAQELPAGDAQWLSWQAPADCPSSEVMQARMERVLARGAGRPAQFRATGEVSKRGQEFVLRLELSLDGRVATRTLSAQDCPSVSDAAAWLVALAADPALPASAAQALDEPAPDSEAPPAPPAEASASQSTAPPTAEPAATAEEKTPPASVPPTAPAANAAASAAAKPAAPVVAERSQPWRLRAAGFAGVFDADLAGVAPSFGARAGVRRDWLVLEASVGLQLARTRALPQRGSISFSSQELALSACLTWGERLRVGVCAHTALLWVHGSARGILQPTAASWWSGRAGGSVEVAWRIAGPIELWLEPRLSVPISARPDFRIDGVGSVAKSAWLLWALHGGVGGPCP